MQIAELVEQFQGEPLNIKNWPNTEGRMDGSYHEMGSNKHHLLTHYHQELYQAGTQTVYLDWSICDECRQLRNKRLVGVDSSDNQGYIKEFIRHGETL